MSADASVGIVMPVRNGADYVAEALESVLAQTYPITQIVVINDGSTDDTVARVRAVAGDDPRLVIHDTGGSGTAAATNAGFDLLTTHYAAIQHQDDRWEPTKIAAQVAAFTPSAAFVGCRMRYIGSTGRVRGRTPYGILTPEQLRDVRAGQYAPCPPSALMVRTADAVRVRFPDDFMPADLDFFRRLACEGDVVMIDECLGDYRLHAGASTLEVYVQARRAPAFLRAREAARAAGGDLTLEQFDRDHPLTFNDRRRYAAGLWGREAATYAFEGQYVPAARLGLMAAVAAPITTVRSVARLR